MFGMVEWTTADAGRLCLEKRRVLNLPFLCAAIPREKTTPELLVRLRCRRAAASLQRAGIRSAVFPPDFPFARDFARRGVLAVDTLPFYRAMAAELAAAAMVERNLAPDSAVVAVCADDLKPEVRRCVTELCIRCRYVMLSCRGGEMLRRELRREYGAVLVLSDNPGQLARADVLVLFSLRSDLQSPGSVLQLYHEENLPEMKFDLKNGGDRECLGEKIDRVQLFSALYAAGILDAKDVKIFGKPCGA